MTTPVEVEIRIAAPPSLVFPYLVEDDKMLQWMGRRVRLDAVVGGDYAIDLDDGNVARGAFVAVEPPHQLVMSWGWDGNDEVPPGSTTVTFDLRADGDDTVLTLTHTGLEGEWPDRHHEGWTHFLSILARQWPEGAPA